MADLEIRAVLRDEFSAASQRLISELRQIVTEGAAAGAAMRNGMASSLPTSQAVVDSLGRQNAQLRAQIQAYNDPAGRRYLDEQKQLRAEIDGLTGAGQKQTGTWTDLVSKYYMASQALSVVAGATMAVVDAASRYDSIKVRIDAFEGSAKAGAAAFAKLQELAKQPGLGLEQASSAYASLRALKESGPEAVKIIEAIAHANASMGGGAEEFGRAMNQIQQMLGKGKLMAEDINTISESIPNFRALMMDAFGTTDTKALNAKYSVDELLKGIEQAAAKLPAPGETIKNNMDNMSDAWTRFKAAIGDAGVIKKTTGFLADLIDRMAGAVERAKASSKVMEEMGVHPEEYERWFPTGLTGATSGSEAGASYASYMAGLSASPPPKAPKPLSESEVKHAAGVAKRAAEARVKAFHEAGEKQRKEAEALAAWQLKVDRDSYEAWAKGQEKRKADREKSLEATKRASKAMLADIDSADVKLGKSIDKRTADQRKRAEQTARAYTAISARFAEGSAQALMVGFAPIDGMFDRMAARNAEMADSFTKTTEAILLAWSSMIVKMAEEYMAKAAIFGLLGGFASGGGIFGAGADAVGFIFGGRASGGAMFPGVSYAYNERQGGEIFRPATAGTASPNYQGRAGDSITINLSGSATQADADRIARALQQSQRGRLRTVTRRG